ncbi:sodium:proton exchanger [Luteipulveratus mongoliensis]|uniref:Ca(2+)/H(+) antiporter n=1 Tax=Luteipulveratus mongoliensis TaxID=571913 RepID=A0A0K1JPR6_9MICO|nr:sodium:proton exchanger [Luteipulveratus mongoliensis]
MCLAAAIATFLTVEAFHPGDVVPFVIAAIALGLLATLVGRSVEALGDQLGAGATGVVQSALGNLPELFVAIFALRAGLTEVVQAAIVGSILANVLMVLGLAFIVGGLKNGTQKFGTDAAKRIALMLLLSVAALLIPALTAALHTPAAGHETALSRVVAVALLVLFALSLPAALRRTGGSSGGSSGGETAGAADAEGEGEAPAWPLPVAIGMLAATAVAAAFVSDWFVTALQPAIHTLHISEAFAGLVIVAIAGNAVENVVGIQLAARNKTDYALSVILQSPVQIAQVLAPVLVLIAPVLGAGAFTLVLPPLLIAALVLSVIVTIVVVLDGESNWYEGACLVGLYAVIAAAFWWG